MNIGSKILTKLKEGRGPVTVISNGTKFSFNSVDEAKKFWTECYYGSEGSEQSRYADILMQLASGKTNISDGTDDRVKSGSDLYNSYKEVKDSGIYKSFNGYNDDGTNKYVDVKVGPGGTWENAEDWFKFMNGGEVVRNPEAWKEFSNEMNKAGYKDELSGIKDKLEKGYLVKLESIEPISEGELHTIENDPLWAEAVKKVNAEWEEEKPEVSKEIEKEYKDFRKSLKGHLTDEEIDNLPETKAYMDAIKDPDDIWCECGEDSDNELVKPNGESYLGVEKEGYICNNCKKYVQIG